MERVFKIRLAVQINTDEEKTEKFSWKLREIISLKILNPELIHFDEMTTNQPLVSLRKLNKFHMKVITL